MKTTAAAASKLIKAILKAEFPTVKFSVLSDTFSGGDAVRIRYTDGPTTDQVRNLVDKFQEGSFNSMEDIYEYDNVNKDLPQVKYVQVNRSQSEEATSQIAASFNFSETVSEYVVNSEIRSVWFKMDLTERTAAEQLAPSHDLAALFVSSVVPVPAVITETPAPAAEVLVFRKTNSGRLALVNNETDNFYTYANKTQANRKLEKIERAGLLETHADGFPALHVSPSYPFMIIKRPAPKPEKTQGADFTPAEVKEINAAALTVEVTAPQKNFCNCLTGSPLNLGGAVVCNICYNEMPAQETVLEKVSKLVKTQCAEFNKPGKFAVAINCTEIGDDNDYSCFLHSAVFKLWKAGEKETALKLANTDTMICEPFTLATLAKDIERTEVFQMQQAEQRRAEANFCRD